MRRLEVFIVIIAILSLKLFIPPAFAQASSGAFQIVSPSIESAQAAVEATDLQAAVDKNNHNGSLIGVVVAVYPNAAEGATVLTFAKNYKAAALALVLPGSWPDAPLQQLIGKKVVMTGHFRMLNDQVACEVGSPEKVLIIATPNAAASATPVPGTSDTAPAAVAARRQPDGIELTRPDGVTVVAASDQAAVSWIPMTGAASYTIDREESANSVSSTVATGVTGNLYLDRGLKRGAEVIYTVNGYDRSGKGVAWESAIGTPDTGDVVFTDDLTDWSNTVDHTDKLKLTKTVNGNSCAERTSSDPQSVTYNLPGSVSLSFDVYFTKDVKGQITVDVSGDGSKWTSVPVLLGGSSPVGSNWLVCVCRVDGALPERTNFLRITLSGSDTESPEISTVTSLYGKTQWSKPVDARAKQTTTQVDHR